MMKMEGEQVKYKAQAISLGVTQWLMKVIVAGVAFLLLSMMLNVGSAHAATNGRMIDDAVFDATSTMSANDIQLFLNQFPNGCLKSYTDDMPVANPAVAYFQYSGTGSAAQIIRRVADNWGINPRVLLAKLEQESSLISGGGGCQLWRQASAIGFKCFDGNNPRTTTFRGSTIQTCVSTDADMGVARQLSKGGWLLKWGKERANGNLNWLVPEDAPMTYGGPMTQGNKKRCSGCSLIYFDGYWNGVYMESGATASLYNYTPYLNQNFDNIWEQWWGAGSTLNANYSWEHVSSVASKPLNSIGSGEQVVITMTAKNVGNRSWDATTNPATFGTAQPYDRSSAFRATDWLSGNRVVAMQETSVAPGATGTFVYTLQAPRAPGTYRESFDLVIDGVAWFNSGGYTLTINVVPATNNSTVISNTLPTAMNANTTATGTITIRNDSNITWQKAGAFPTILGTSAPYSRASQFMASDWLSSSVPVRMQETSVAPGANATFVVTLKAPPTNGTYVESFNALQDKLTWTTGSASKTIVVSNGIDAPSKPVFRLFNPRTGDHFYTISTETRDSFRNQGYEYEWPEFYAYDAPVSGSIPIYRLYNSRNGDHFYTNSAAGRDAVMQGGYAYEGIEFYAFPTSAGGAIPIYRLFNPRNGDHIYLSNPAGRDAVMQGGYEYEWIEFYARASGS